MKIFETFIVFQNSQHSILLHVYPMKILSVHHSNVRILLIDCDSVVHVIHQTGSSIYLCPVHESRSIFIAPRKILNHCNRPTALVGKLKMNVLNNVFQRTMPGKVACLQWGLNNAVRSILLLGSRFGIRPGMFFLLLFLFLE